MAHGSREADPHVVSAVACSRPPRFSEHVRIVLRPCQRIARAVCVIGILPNFSREENAPVHRLRNSQDSICGKNQPCFFMLTFAAALSGG